MSEPIKVPRLAKGHGYKGPEFYGCYNTGMAPAIFHSRTGKYVVGSEIPCRDAMRAGMTLVDKRTVKGSDPRRTVWVFKGRKAAVAKFLALCGAQILENARQRQAHAAARSAAARGDLAAALSLGDFYMSAFQVIEQGPHGDTVIVANPKLEAYKQAAYVQNVLGRRYNLTCRPDGTYTVQGDGLAALTFQLEQAT